MRAFRCPCCAALVHFENAACLRCGAALGFDPRSREVTRADAAVFARCANTQLVACSWLVPAERAGSLCASCALTRTRPADGDELGLTELVEAERAKRRLLFQLLELGLPFEGVAFDLLSSEHEPVTIGHDEGLITLDVAESDDASRERRRAELGEPYRTLLGHFRHEIGHFFWDRLVAPDAGELEHFRARFGDERAGYAEALDRHYADGAPAGWEDGFVSAYASMHPWEDWAETFAHYLHMRDTLQTAGAFGLAIDGPERDPVTPDGTSLEARPDEPRPGRPFADVLDQWVPLTVVVNELNRSMGHADLYPFVLAPDVVAKLGHVHEVVERACANSSIDRNTAVT